MKRVMIDLETLGVNPGCVILAVGAVLFNGARGEDFFRQCGEFAKAHRTAPGECQDNPALMLTPIALDWFRAMTFTPLPGGRPCKPTSWQMEKARKYLASRHNTLLAEQLADAERIRQDGDGVRADRLATEARKAFSSFTDAAANCRRVMDMDTLPSGRPLGPVCGGKMLAAGPDEG